jgi:signal transduction histidine kinase
MADSIPQPVPADAAGVSRLVARERVHAMESLAGTVAHEIRSAVLGISSAAQLLRYGVPLDPVAEKNLGRILLEAERLSAIHDALSEYATEMPPRFVAGDPDDVWRDVLAGMRGALEANSLVATHVPPAVRAKCLIDPDQLARAFERVIHLASARSRGASEVVVTSVIAPDGSWHSIVTSRGGRPAAANSADTPAFLIALANRTLVAHGGDVVDESSEGLVRVAIRLPFSRPTE